MGDSGPTQHDGQNVNGDGGLHLQHSKSYRNKVDSSMEHHGYADMPYSKAIWHAGDCLDNCSANLNDVDPDEGSRSLNIPH